MTIELAQPGCSAAAATGSCRACKLNQWASAVFTYGDTGHEMPPILATAGAVPQHVLPPARSALRTKLLLLLLLLLTALMATQCAQTYQEGYTVAFAMQSKLLIVAMPL